MRARPPVAVVARSLLTAAGSTELSWKAAHEGMSAIAPLDDPDYGALVGLPAARVDVEPVLELIGRKRARRMDRATWIGIAAALEAVQSLNGLAVDPRRAGIVLGVGLGATNTFFHDCKLYLDPASAARLNPLVIPVSMPNATAACIAEELGWHGGALTVSTACASGADAVRVAASQILTGDLDVVLAGGLDAFPSPQAFAGFHRLKAMASVADPIGASSRPFDATRDGFVMGEGAGLMVLASDEWVERSGATALFHVAGWATRSEAHNLVAPEPSGSILVACMSDAIASAGLTTDDIDHVNAHGTSTQLNDAIEGTAIGALFGAGFDVVASKSVFGHPMGGAGAVEAVVCGMAVETGESPATAGCATPDPDIPVHVLTRSRPLERRAILTNSFGFGGHDTSLVITA